MERVCQIITFCDHYICQNLSRTILLFFILPFLAHLTPKRHQNSNLTWSANIIWGWSLFSMLWVFYQVTSTASNLSSKYFFSKYNFPNYPNFVRSLKLCQIPPQTFWTESVLVQKGDGGRRQRHKQHDDGIGAGVLSRSQNMEFSPLLGQAEKVGVWRVQGGLLVSTLIPCR